MFNSILWTILGRSIGEKQPWEKDNSWLIPVSIQPVFVVSEVFYRKSYTTENISAGITDISFVVTKV